MGGTVTGAREFLWRSTVGSSGSIRYVASKQWTFRREPRIDRIRNPTNFVAAPQPNYPIRSPPFGLIRGATNMTRPPRAIKKVRSYAAPIRLLGAACLCAGALAACGGSSGPSTYTVGGTVTGLAAGASIVLQNSGGDSITVSSDSKFTFPTPIVSGTTYAVSIATQPTFQGCSITAASGVVAQANVTNVTVHCPLVTTLYSFRLGGDGNVPQAGLVLGSDGNFYGTTQYGGAANFGTVYRMTPDGTETVITSFAAAPDGGQPYSALVQGSDGDFYGTTSQGGAFGGGTVFKLTPSGVKTILWSFGSGVDGSGPRPGLIQGNDGNLYGTTTYGGANDGGTVFRITPSGSETVLWGFGAGTDGRYPYAALVQGTDGNLYGTTVAGGSTGVGTVFRLTLAGVETVLLSLDAATTGSQPEAPLIQATDGNFYGTASFGGVNGGGTLFKISSSGAATVVYSFRGGTDAALPTTGVIQGSDGDFYGTTAVGGTLAGCGDSGTQTGVCGTMFKVTPGGVETVLWDFGPEGNGWYPLPVGLVQGRDGYLYGVNSGAGENNQGAVYRLVP